MSQKCRVSLTPSAPPLPPSPLPSSPCCPPPSISHPAPPQLSAQGAGDHRLQHVGPLPARPAARLRPGRGAAHLLAPLEEGPHARARPLQAGEAERGEVGGGGEPGGRPRRQSSLSPSSSLATPPVFSVLH